MSPFKKCSRLLGELLREKKIITTQQLAQALSLQQKASDLRPLGELLIELGYLTRKKLTFFLFLQEGYPYLEINNFVFSPEILKILPQEFCIREEVIPLERIGEILTIATYKPEKELISKIEKITKLKVKAFLSWPSDVEDFLKKKLTEPYE